MANNSFAYIEKTLPGIVDKVFAKESMTDSLIGGSEIKLDFLDAKTVKIFMLASTGLTNYQRGGHGSSNTRGSAQSTTETFELSQERYSEIPLDKLDTLDDGETVLGHLAKEFIRTKTVPEFDTYRFSKLAGYTNEVFGNRLVETIAANTIISKFNKAFKWLAEQKVPAKDQIIYVNPDVMELIRNTNEVYKKLDQTDYRSDYGVSFTINKYEGRPIVEVPSDEFYTDAITGDGYYPSEKSKVINFMIVSKSAPIIVKKLDYAKVYNSTDENGAYLGFAGYLLTNLYYHDLFVPQNKKPGIYCSVSEVDGATKASSLLVEAVAGTAQGNTIIKSVLTQPAGILYDKLYLSTAEVNIGDNTNALTLITIGTQFAVGDNAYIVASYDGKAVATTGDMKAVLPVGA